MRTQPLRVAHIALALALVPAAWACGGRDDADVDTIPGTEVTTGAVRVTDVDLGTAVGPDNRVTAANVTDTFRPTDMIYASVATDGAASGSSLTARWTYEDGQVVDETTETLTAAGPSVTQFHIMKPDGFPTGSYQLEILVDGRSVERKDFAVR
jgi:hypothetical protein